MLHYKWVLNNSQKENFLKTLKGEYSSYNLMSDVLVDNSSLHSNFQWKLEITIMSITGNIPLKIILVRADQFDSFRADYVIKIYVTPDYCTKQTMCRYENKSLFDIKHKKCHQINSLTNTSTYYLKLEKISSNEPKCSIEIHFDMNITGLDSVSNICSTLQEIPDFEKLLDDPTFSDFIIICSGKKFNVHKNILAARSEVFSTMFEIDMKEKREGKLTIDDFNPEVMQELLRFMYCGKVKYLEKFSTDLLKAAHMYSIHGLGDLCMENDCKNLCANNAVKLLSMAIDYKAEALKSKIINFIVLNMKEVSNNSDFKTLADPSALQEIINKTVRMWL